MDSTFFEKPIIVLVGLGFPRKIESAGEAYQFLSDMQLTGQKTAQKIALRACREAMMGAIEPETARSAFVAFAHRCGILLSSDDSREVGSNGTDAALDWNDRLVLKSETPTTSM
jgi:hypothetical protein